MPAKIVTAFALACLLAACGGGGGGGGAPSSGNGNPEQPPAGGSPPPAGGGNLPPPGDGTPPPGDGTPPPGDGTPPPGDGTPPPGDGTPPPSDGTPPPDDPTSDFSARVTAAPADGQTIQQNVHLEIEGQGIQNAELLPATGYKPIYARLELQGDGSAKTLFDTRLLNDGPVTMRISAFDRPPGGEGARELVAMAPRTWQVANGFDWRQGDTHVVQYPSIYPLSQDAAFLRNWLDTPDTEHEENYQDQAQWEAFLDKTATYVPHHIAFTHGSIVLMSSRHACIHDMDITGCRLWIQAVLGRIDE